jgi:phenylpyruvate tautomerase PptA (4-oxalocrotonate tautomerase family)
MPKPKPAEHRRQPITSSIVAPTLAATLTRRTGRLHTNGHYSTSIKRDLARRMSRVYAEIMQTTPDLVNVAFRELGEGSVWNGAGEAPSPAAVLSLEIRRGRPPEQRERLAKALLAAVVEALGLDPTLTPIEMTEHAGDEIYMERYVDGVLYGTLGRDWNPKEVDRPLIETMIAKKRAAGAD